MCGHAHPAFLPVAAPRCAGSPAACAPKRAVLARGSRAGGEGWRTKRDSRRRSQRARGGQDLTIYRWCPTIAPRSSSTWRCRWPAEAVAGPCRRDPLPSRSARAPAAPARILSTPPSDGWSCTYWGQAQDDPERRAALLRGFFPPSPRGVGEGLRQAQVDGKLRPECRPTWAPTCSSARSSTGCCSGHEPASGLISRGSVVLTGCQARPGKEERAGKGLRFFREMLAAAGMG